MFFLNANKDPETVELWKAKYKQACKERDKYKQLIDSVEQYKSEYETLIKEAKEYRDRLKKKNEEFDKIAEDYKKQLDIATKRNLDIIDAN